MQVIIKLFQLYVIINHVFGNAKGSKAYLKSVILVPRHGERTALSTYDNDPNALYWMKYGFGSLTDNGEKRMRHLGEFLRKRYDSIWPEKEKIYVRSNRENRCIQSAEHLISGAYNEDFLSNPVKIHNVPIEEDIMMSFNAKCPVYDKELDRVFNLPDMKQWINSYANLIKYFEEKCGSDSVDSSLKVGGLFDNFCSIKENNLTTPIWLNDTIYNRTAEFIDRYFVELFRTTLQKRLRVGSFLAEIRNQINLIESNNTFDSVRIYSG
ncbi:Lysosomal acid phosphatase-like protein, partial [Leptotrombidium deliense]